jgi:hypothetical protein
MGVQEELPAPVYCFTSLGKQFVTRGCDIRKYWVTVFPTWDVAVPLLRHRCFNKRSGQMVLFDVATKVEFRSSPVYPHEAFSEFICSADGKIVVGRSFNGQLRVWRVPN